MQKHVRKEMLADFCCAVGMKVKKSAEADPLNKPMNSYFTSKLI